MISAINKSPPSGNRFELDFSFDTKARPLCCALRMLTPPDIAGIAMVARRTPQMNRGDISFPPRVIGADTAATSSPVDSATREVRNASGRRLRNRLLLINAAVWVAVIVACRMIFF
ncbi:MAG: hypothetical protein V4477_19215 [Pseudomonadota bacterium]